MQLTLSARTNCPEASLDKLQRSDFTYMIMYNASLRHELYKYRHVLHKTYLYTNTNAYGVGNVPVEHNILHNHSWLQ